MNDELIIDGLDPEDFILLKEILSTTQIPISEKGKFVHAAALLDKICQIVDALSK